MTLALGGGFDSPHQRRYCCLLTSYTRREVTQVAQKSTHTSVPEIKDPETVERNVRRQGSSLLHYLFLYLPIPISYLYLSLYMTYRRLRLAKNGMILDQKLDIILGGGNPVPSTKLEGMGGTDWRRTVLF